MYRLKTLIVEDHLDEAQVLQRRLIPFDFIQEPIIALSYEEALDLLSGQKFDLTFLDIDLGKKITCFELIDNVPKENLGFVVYVTALDGGVDPRDFDRINWHTVIRKPVNRINLEGISEKLENYALSFEPIKMHLFRSSDGNKVIAADDIFYIKGVNNYSHIVYLQNKDDFRNFTYRKSLSEIDILDEKIFWRVHKSFIVNRHNVDLFVPDGKGKEKGIVKFVKKVGTEVVTYTNEMLNKCYRH